MIGGKATFWLEISESKDVKLISTHPSSQKSWSPFNDPKGEGPWPENQGQTQWNNYSELARALIAHVLLEKQQLSFIPLTEPLKFRKLNSNLLIGKH